MSEWILIIQICSFHSFVNLNYLLNTSCMLVAVNRQLGFPMWYSGQETTCSVGDVYSIPGSGGSPEEGNGNPLQDSWLENSMDRKAWWTRVHGVSKNWTRLNDWALIHTRSSRQHKEGPSSCVAYFLEKGDGKHKNKETVCSHTKC